MPQPTTNPPRASRSRFSSPLPASANSNESSRASSNNPGAGGQQTLLGWLEPPVNMKASYQDAGLMRHGVVGNMAPLGTMPKVGVFKKAAAPLAPPQQESHPPVTPNPVRKIIIKQRTTVSTPTPTPAPPPASTPAPEADETEEEEHGDTDIDEVDDDSEMHAARSISGRHSFAGYGDDDRAARSSSTQMHSRGSISYSSVSRMGSAVSQGAPMHGIPRLDRAYIDGVVERAVTDALDHHRYPTAYALRMLYDEQSGDPEMLALFARWFYQMASDDDLERIARLMFRKKREGHKHDTAYHYFVPPPRDELPPEEKLSSFGHLVNVDLSKLHFEPARPAGPAQSVAAPAQPAESIQPEADQQVQPGQPDEPAKSEQPEQRDKSEQPEAQSPVRSVKSPPRSSKKRKTRHSDSATRMAANGVNGKVKTDSPSKRRGRRDSQSSSSTLSSARSLSPPEDVFSVPTSRASPAVEEEPAEAAPPPKRRRSYFPRKHHGNVSPPEAPPSPAASQSAASAPAAEPQSAPFTMPEALNSPMFPNLNGKKGKGNQRIVFPSKVGTLDENDEMSRLRRRAKQISRSEVPEASFSRPPVPEPEAQAAGVSARNRASLPANRATPAPPGRTTRSTRKRSHDELEEQPSPTVAVFPASDMASMTVNSRAGTPAARAGKKPRTSLRIKNSPVKKKGSTAAGMPRPSGERSSPVLNGAPREDENDDYCTSCSGNGELVCCDGCTRSLHLSCIDPPLPEDSMPPQWFCNECRSKHQAPPVYKGPFRDLLDQLESRNSSAFILPRETRDKFDGVRTGPDGEYEEIRPPPPKPGRKKKNDEDAMLEFYRLRDPANEDKAVLCHACVKPCTETRPIVPCPDCGLHWHLDCVDPPMANVPVVLRDWRCPAHVDDLLKELPGSLGPAHRHRKIKGAPVIQPAFSRGNANNGYIDVVADYDDDTSDMPTLHDCSGWRDVENYGRVVGLSGRGIQKDFISRIRRNRKGKQIAPLVALEKAVLRPKLLPRDVLEQQLAAHTLAQLSSGTNIASLIDALVTNADSTVNALIVRSAGDRLAANMGQDDLRQTLAILDVLANKLRSKVGAVAPEPPSTPDNDGAALLDTEVPSLTNSQSSSVESDNLIQDDSKPHAAEMDLKKNLPSPAATDDVNGASQLEEQPKDAGATGVISPRLKRKSASDALPGNSAEVNGTSVEAAAVSTQDADGADVMDLD